jgi:fatty-acyl-CoA synthase
LPKLKNVVCLGENKPHGAFSLEEFVASSKDAGLERALSERHRSIRTSEPAKIFFTSGTTSFPKGAVLNQHLWKNMNSIAERIQIKEDDRILVATPMFYILGNLQLVLAPLLKGASVCPVERFDPTLIFRTVEQRRCTILDGVPGIYQALLESRDLDRFDLTSLRTGRVGGAPISLSLVNEIIHRLHIPELHAMYGLTECTGVSMATHKGDPPELLAETVGTPLPGTDTRVVDPDSGRELSQGESGELWIKGHMVTDGYYRQQKETAKVLTDGWFHTGDLMRRRPDGYYEFIGRSKDLIKRGGENVSPPEVEVCIARHPSVDHVEVLGIPNVKYGEVGVAFVKIKKGARISENDILGFCSERLARFKIPAHVFFVDRFPQTATGKIQKFKLREQAIDKLKVIKGEE